MTTFPINIVVPRGIDFLTWVGTLYADLPNLNIPFPTSEDDWKDWGESMLLENELVNIPLPENFNDWREWAEYFVNNV
jgi:hypothetical protein